MKDSRGVHAVEPRPIQAHKTRPRPNRSICFMFNLQQAWISNTYTIFVIAIVLWIHARWENDFWVSQYKCFAATRWSAAISMNRCGRWIVVITFGIVNSLHCKCAQPDLFTTFNHNNNNNKYQSIFNDRTNKTGREPRILQRILQVRGPLVAFG